MMDSLRELFIDEIRDLLSAERQITEALPKMSKAASAPELQQAFQEHLHQTKGQVERLKQVFEVVGRAPRAKKCMGMEGLIKEGEELMHEDAEPAVMDAGLIGAAQKVEHYEIAAYGTARTHARQLGLNDAARLLQQTLDEESQTNEKLTRIAEGLVNLEAAEGAAIRQGNGANRRK